LKIKPLRISHSENLVPPGKKILLMISKKGSSQKGLIIKRDKRLQGTIYVQYFGKKIPKRKLEKNL